MSAYPRAPEPRLATEPQVESLVALMQREALDGRFLSLMGPGDRPFEGAARIGVRNPEWAGPFGTVPKWIDGPPIYPDSPDAVRFFGNFAEVSHGFTLDLDDAGLIERMRAAIEQNIATFQVRAR